MREFHPAGESSRAPRRVSIRASIGLAVLLVASACSSPARPRDEVAHATSGSVQTHEPIPYAQQLFLMLPFVNPPLEGAALNRARMEPFAGTSHFKNSQLITARDKLSLQRAEFTSDHDRFVAAPFVDARATLRGNQRVPLAGSVRAQALAAAAAAAAGVRVIPVQPVLAELLPAFGF